MTSVDVLTVFGVAVVLPWAVPAIGRRAWTATAGAAAGALILPEGIGAAAVAATWPLLTGAATVTVARVWWASVPRSLDGAAEVAALAFATVAGAALVQSCLGRSAFGIHEPIVQLTAVHFAFAGAGGTALAGAALSHAPGRRGLATVALVLTATAPPVVALGFVTGTALPQVGGALLMTVGVWSTAVAQLAALGDRTRQVQVLLVASSSAVFAAMPLAVGWAAAQHWGGIPALSIPDMVRTHGMLNGVVFVPCGLLAWRLIGRASLELVACRA